MDVYLLDGARIIAEQAADKRTPLKVIAVTYASAIRTATAGIEAVDWKIANEALVAHRGEKGRDRVKARAWKILDGKVAP